ncbi:MAG: DUF5677 domain-containing protein [Dehalococcoidia bacterium]|nr:DUF5677 domain-containing protein [Dehalococcoidia bacterium]
MANDVSENDAHDLANLVFEHLAVSLSLTTNALTPPLPPNSSKITIYATGSARVVTRAALEAYLMFNYLFVSPKSADEREFRYLAYKITGLIERQSIPAVDPNNKKKLQYESELIKELTARLQSNNTFKGMKENEQRRIIKGNWRPPSWKTLIEEANLPPLVKMMYDHLCIYAHSKYTSVIQLATAYEKGEHQLLNNPMFSLFNIITARMIDDYCKVFPRTRDAIPASHQDTLNNWLQLIHGLMSEP